MTDWQPIKTTTKEQVLSAMELLLTAKQINYVKSKTFSGPSKIAVIRRLINIGIQVEATDEIEQLREEIADLKYKKTYLERAYMAVRRTLGSKGIHMDYFLSRADYEAELKEGE